MQSDFNRLNTALLEPAKHLCGEMQPRCRSCHRAALARKNRLIPFDIEPLFLVALDIGRQRGAAYLVDYMIKIAIDFKPHDAASSLAPFNYFSLKLARRKIDPSARHQRFTWLGEHLPH